MKTLKFFIALTVCATVMVSCTKDAMLDSAQDAEQRGIARSPGGKYSDYIITPEEAMNMVDKDLQESGGEFAKKQVSHVEPVMNEVFMELYSQKVPLMIEMDLIKSTDPMLYIVHFEDEGFAIVQPDSRLGAEIMSAQTFYTISCEDFYRNANTGPMVPNEDSLLCFCGVDNIQPPKPVKPPNLFWDESTSQIIALILRIWQDVIDRGFGNPTNIYDTSAPWYTTKTHTANTQFFLKAGAPLNTTQGYYLGMISPAVIGFLGYKEMPNTMFGQTGDWTYIKQGFWLYPAFATPPVGFWADKISKACKADAMHPLYGYVGDFNKVTPLLNELGFPCTKKRYSNFYYGDYDYTQIDNSQLTALIRAGSPVLVYHNGTVGLAFKEDIKVKEIYWRGLNNVILSTIYHYKSKIYYKVSLEDKVDEKYVYTDAANNNLYYIAY